MQLKKGSPWGLSAKVEAPEDATVEEGYPKALGFLSW
jgi:hypothetical protein